MRVPVPPTSFNGGATISRRVGVWRDGTLVYFRLTQAESTIAVVSEFSVIASALYEHAGRLRGFSGEIENARGRVAGGAGAAAGTPAAGGVEQLTGHVHARLADFGAASDALHRAVAGAGDAYARADACVAESAS